MKELTEQDWKDHLIRRLNDFVNPPKGGMTTMPMSMPLNGNEARIILSLLSKDQPVVGAEEVLEKYIKTTVERAIQDNSTIYIKTAIIAMEDFASAVASKMAREKVREYKNPYNQKKQYVEWAAVENALDDLLRNELKNKLKSEQMKDNHEELRKLTAFQHWLGTNYSNLPTDSGNMTKRARIYYESLNKQTKE